MRLVVNKPNLALTILTASLLSLCVSAIAKNAEDVADLELTSLLDDVVYSASKHAESLDETPANVHIITRAMIENYGCATIAEALSLAPGVYITNDYALSQIGIRGISSFGDWNSHVMVLLDGRPITEHYGGTNSIDLPGLTIENIEQIEIIKGPASSLYGSNAFFGMINLIPRKFEDGETSISSEYNSALDSRQVSYHLSRRLGKHGSIQSFGTILDQIGSKLFFEEYSDLSDNTLLTQDNDGYYQFYLDSASFTGGFADGGNTVTKQSLYTTLSWKKWSVILGYGKMNTGLAPSAWGSLFNSPENKFKEHSRLLKLQYQTNVSEKTTLNSSISYKYYRWSDHIAYNYGIWEPTPAYLPGPIWADYEYDKSFSAETRVDISLNQDSRLVLGAEAQLHDISHVSGETDQGGETVLANVIPSESVSNKGQIYNLYGQFEHTLSAKLKAVGGLHFNYYTFTTGKVTPKGALVYSPYDGGTYKFIASSGFRSPSFYEITYTDGDFYAANPDLTPESITSYELISTHEFPFGFALDLATNYSRITNLIQQAVIDTTDPGHPGPTFQDEVYQFRNNGEMRSSSFEIGVRRHAVYRLSGMANLSYQRLKIAKFEDQTQPSNSPRWLSNVGITYQITPRKLAASLKMNHISSRLLWDESVLAPITLFDASVSAKNIWGGIDLTLSAKNILDKKYSSPISFDYAPSTTIQMPGRSAQLRLRFGIH